MKTSFHKVSLAVLAIAVGFGVSAGAQQQRVVGGASVQGGRAPAGDRINILGAGGNTNPRGDGRGGGVGVVTTTTIPNGRYFENSSLELARGTHSFSSFMTPAGINLLNQYAGKETLIISGYRSFDTDAIGTGKLYLSCGAVVDIRARTIDTTRVIDGCAGSPNDGLAFWTGARIDAAGNLSAMPSFVTGVRFSFQGAGSGGRDTVLVGVDKLQKVIDECKRGTTGNANADTAMKLAMISTGLSGTATVTSGIQTGIEIGRAVRQGDSQSSAVTKTATPLVKNEFERVVTEIAARENMTPMMFREAAITEASRLTNGSCNARKMNLPAIATTGSQSDILNLERQRVITAFGNCVNSADQQNLADSNSYTGTAILSGATTLLAAGSTATSAINIMTIDKIKKDFEELQAARASCAKAVTELAADIEFHKGTTTATRK